MSEIKDDITKIAETVQKLDHSQPEVVEHHDLLWQMLCKHRKTFGMGSTDLNAIANTDMHTEGGGTDKTVPQ